MPSINLLKKTEDKKELGSLAGSNRGLVVSVSLLVILLLLVFGVKIYLSSLHKKIVFLEGQIRQESLGLVGSEVDRIGDLQRRIGKIKENLKAENSQRIILSEIEKTIVPGVVVSELKEENEKITITFQAKSFTDVAKQMISLKKNDNFSGVVLSDIKRDEENNLVFSNSMSLK